MIETHADYLEALAMVPICKPLFRMGVAPMNNGSVAIALTMGAGSTHIYSVPSGIAQKPTPRQKGEP